MPKQTHWTTRSYATWLEAFLETLQVTPVGLIGHSYGGKVLLEYASRTQPTGKIALLAPSGIRLPKTAKQSVLSHLVGVFPDSFKRLIPNRLRILFYTSIVQETDYLLASPFQKETLRHILNEDYTERAERLPSGTLIIGGISDEAVHPEALRILAQRIPKAQLHLLETGHFPFQEKPKECVQLLKDFFS